MIDPLDIVGVKYKTIEVVTYLSDISGPKKGHFYKCICLKCGKESVKRRAPIANKNACTCTKVKHGKVGSTEYCCWSSMKNRCYVKTNKHYKHYGGRGIEVCDRWANSFENFYADMGPKPSKEYSLDRINANKNYELSNCRWATSNQQARNKRNNVLNEAVVKEIRRLKNEEGLGGKAISKKLDLKVRTVYSVLHNESWKELEE